MSAWIVSKGHIDRMVSTALAWELISVEHATAIGRTLWVENLKSVAERYPDDKSGERSGSGETDKEIKSYEFTAEVPPLTPVEMMKAIHCLDYQSCEHDGWPESVACKLLTEFIAEVLARTGSTIDQSSRLPGYDEAPWGF